MRSAEHHTHFAREVAAAQSAAASPPRVVVAVAAGPRLLIAVFLSFALSLAWATAASAQTVVQHGISEGTTSSLQ